MECFSYFTLNSNSKMCICVYLQSLKIKDEVFSNTIFKIIPNDIFILFCISPYMKSNIMEYIYISYFLM